MNKFPNTDSIFTVIGNEPVLDQLDVSYSALLSGSTVDNYVTGSLISKKFGFSFAGVEGNFVFGERGLAFSKTDSLLKTKYPITDVSDENSSAAALWTSYSLQPWSERSGILRNLRIFSSSERYYDSLVPSLGEMVAALAKKYPNNQGIYISIISSGAARIYIGNNLDSPPGVLGLVESFPFETTYSNVKRIRRISKGYLATHNGGGVVLQTPVNTDRIRIIYKYKNGDTQEWFDWAESGFLSAGEIKEKDTAKVIFGFGDYNTTVPNPVYKYSFGSKNLLEYRASIAIGGDLPEAIFSPILRGWKYGLIDGNPHYTSCVFRRDRFGQLRDMLEQRVNSAFITDESNSTLNYLGGVEKPATPPTISSKNKAERVAYPLEVAFVKQDIVANKLVYTTQEPDNTWSSNLSTYATSSLPFFDDDLNGTNRDATSFGKITTGITLNVARDFFGNLSIG